MISFKKKLDNYNLYEVDVIDSTNDYLKDHYNEFNDKSILLAHTQTKGRGRLDHKWISGKDLTFSIIFNHKENYQTPALAIILALEELRIDAKIKWPNDIIYNDMKLSGILIEEIYEDKFMASIVGIGINLTDKEEFSVKDLGILYNIDKYELLAKIIKNYEILLNKSKEEIYDLYKTYSLVLNKDISYNNIIYKVKDIASDGALLVEKDNIVCRIDYGDIILINSKIHVLN